MDLLSKLWVLAAFGILIWCLAMSWVGTMEWVAQQRYKRYLQKKMDDAKAKKGDKE